MFEVRCKRFGLCYREEDVDATDEFLDVFVGAQVADFFFSQCQPRERN